MNCGITLVSESVLDYVTTVIFAGFFLAERFFVVSILVSTRGLFRKCCPPIHTVPNESKDQTVSQNLPNTACTRTGWGLRPARGDSCFAAFSYFWRGSVKFPSPPLPLSQSVGRPVINSEEVACSKILFTGFLTLSSPQSSPFLSSVPTSSIMQFQRCSLHANRANPT